MLIEFNRQTKVRTGVNLKKARWILIAGIILILAGGYLTLTYPPLGVIGLATGLILSLGANMIANFITGSRKPDDELFLKIIKDTKDELRKFQTIIKVKNISVPELVKHYEAPLNGLLILPYNQKLDKKEQLKIGKKLSKEEQRFIGKRLKGMGAIGLNGGFYFVPPTIFDQNIKTKEQIGKWVHRNIISHTPKGLRYTIVMASIINLKTLFAEQKKEKPEQWGETLLDMIPPSRMFDKEFLIKEIKGKTSLKEILDFASPSIFASEILKQDDLKVLIENQNKIYEEIEKKLGHSPTLEEYASMQTVDLEEILKDYVPNPKIVAQHVIGRAQETRDII